MTYELHHGDALAILRDLPTASVDALITDPPYSSGGQYKGDRSASTGLKYTGSHGVIPDRSDFSGDNRDQRSFLTWMNLWLGEGLRVVRSGGICALFTDWRQLPTMTDALQVGGWVWRGIVPWAKPGGRPLYKQRAWMNQCEYVVWGTAGSSAVTEDGGTEPLQGFYVAAPPRDRLHQTQKPLDVMRGLCAVVPKGGTILDPFMGSGTTGAAAVLNGTNFVGIELDAHYHDLAASRIEAAERGYVDDGEQLVLQLGDGAA